MHTFVNKFVLQHIFITKKKKKEKVFQGRILAWIHEEALSGDFIRALIIFTWKVSFVCIYRG